MADFVKAVEANGKTYRFEFNRIYSLNGFKYFITVKISIFNSHHFIMEQSAGEWYIIFTPLLPEWLKQFESKLSDAINSIG